MHLGIAFSISSTTGAIVKIVVIYILESCFDSFCHAAGKCTDDG